ncbi:hypothetical protein FAVG1_13114 [Fusarium avenaceum]|nr:hypothetical protein FAVG1_13114 [Fusarium avenaceum]
MTKTAQTPGFTLKTGSPPNFFSRRIVISGVIECETSYLVGYAIAPEDLNHVRDDVVPGMAVDKLGKAKHKFHWLAKGVEKVATDSIRSMTIVGPPAIKGEVIPELPLTLVLPQPCLPRKYEEYACGQ